MAERNAGKAGVMLGSAALVAAAIALAKQKIAKAAPEGTIVLDRETMELLIALAQTSANVEELLSSLIRGIEEEEAVIQVQGYAPNTETGMATRIQVAALATPYQLPDIPVPDDMILQLKGWPTNGGTLFIGFSRAGCTNINQSWPLLANEAIGYRVQNAKEIYAGGIAPLSVAGDWLAITVEQRRR